MGNSIITNSFNNDLRTELKRDNKTIRLLSYNVEWGFLKLPPDIHQDSCGHSIPDNIDAQKTHLKLIAKNIGLLSSDITLKGKCLISF